MHNRKYEEPLSLHSMDPEKYDENQTITLKRVARTVTNKQLVTASRQLSPHIFDPI